jgi:hypothetical protein
MQHLFSKKFRYAPVAAGLREDRAIVPQLWGFSGQEGVDKSKPGLTSGKPGLKVTQRYSK